MFLVDSHCHLDLLNENNLDEVVHRAQENDIRYMLNVCVSIHTFPQVLKTAKMYPFVAASIGLHPNEQDEEVREETLIELGSDEKVIAVGETGLDYFRTTGDLTWQQNRFRAHIHAAKKLKKPLIIHTREAKADTLKIMQEENAADIGGVMHCFTEDLAAAKAALAMNFYISFSGIVTFKNATTLQAVAKSIPLDRMLIETDAPYLAPHPLRGKTNEPSYLRHTAEYLAELHHVSLEEFAALTTKNFFTLFQGAVRPHV